jgi:tetratricopeptide (TPR) repeat protein
VEEVRDIARSLCEALSYAHRLTVHRDVKPENIWLGEDGSVKLMDFGIARLLRPSQFTSTGMALGTAYYMAPEQLRGQEIDHGADQFAMGVILYELLTGVIPQGVIQAPQQVRRSVPPELSEAVMKALAGDREKRHSDMAALGRGLGAKPRRQIGRTVSAISVVAVFLLAGITHRSWRPVAERLYSQVTGGQTSAGADEPRGDERTAQEAYAEVAAEIDGLRSQAEAVGAGIESESKASQGGVAEQIADLWRRHTGRREWLEQAEQSWARAGDGEGGGIRQGRGGNQGGGRSVSQAGRVARPREAGHGFHRAEPRDAGRSAGPVPGEHCADALGLAGGPDERGRGQAGERRRFRRAGRGRAHRRTAARYREATVLAAGGRQDAREATGSEQLEELRARSEEAAARLQDADAALVRDRQGDARRLYTAAANLERALLTELNRHLAELIESGTSAFDAGRFDAAAVKAQAALKLRPDDETALALARRAENGARIARIRAYERAGERDEALSALTELRRQKPDDPEVRRLVDEYTEKFVDDYQALLRSNRLVLPFLSARPVE